MILCSTLLPRKKQASGSCSLGGFLQHKSSKAYITQIQGQTFWYSSCIIQRQHISGHLMWELLYLCFLKRAVSNIICNSFPGLLRIFVPQSSGLSSRWRVGIFLHPRPLFFGASTSKIHCKLIFLFKPVPYSQVYIWINRTTAHSVGHPEPHWLPFLGPSHAFNQPSSPIEPAWRPLSKICFFPSSLPSLSSAHGLSPRLLVSRSWFHFSPVLFPLTLSYSYTTCNQSDLSKSEQVIPV